jgi:hypothetical protein
VYFQVYHPRVPVVNPTRLREQFGESLRRSSTTKKGNYGHPFLRNTIDKFSGTVSDSTQVLTSKPIHRPLLAIIIAWGSKFSDHDLLVKDRQQAHYDSSTGGYSKLSTYTRSSSISRLLVDRAREVAEQEKVFRIPSPQNVVCCILLEPLQPLQSCRFCLKVH